MWRATIRDRGDGGFLVTFGDDPRAVARLKAPDLQAAITEAQARWPELDFRPWRQGDGVPDDVVAVSP
jgi:hypothetical protein